MGFLFDAVVKEGLGMKEKGENRMPWKQKLEKIKAKLNTEAAIKWMPQESVKLLVLDKIAFWARVTLMGLSPTDVPPKIWTAVNTPCKHCWCPPPASKHREEGVGRKQNLRAGVWAEQNKGHFLTLYTMIFIIFFLVSGNKPSDWAAMCKWLL